MSLIDSAPLRQVYRIQSTVLCEHSWAREVDNNAKDTFLPLSRNTGESGEKLMEELSRIDPWAASQFGLKNVAVRDFVMRLWYESGSSSQDALQQEDSSFIILSYTWHSSEWTTHPSLGCHSNESTQRDVRPLTPAMWSAFLLQRLSPSEGLWCDQLCIVQTSSQEQKLAIGAMDLLYKNARKVIVALEDIALTQEEMDALFKINLNFGLSRQQGGSIARAFERIVHARWFRRSWCLHEFLLSRNHTFLIPVSDEGRDGVVTIVELDALFLAIMANFFAKVEYLDYLSKQYTLLATLDQDLNLIHGFIMRLKLLSTIDVNEPELFYSHGAYTGMHTFSEVFSLGAYRMADKISILLNVMNSGLYYLGPESSMEEEDCLRFATVVALASGDPEALTTNGGPVHSPNRKPETQWLRLPILTDTNPQLGSDPRLRKIGTDLAVTAQGLQLDMHFICTSASIASAEPRYLSIAMLLIDHREKSNSTISSAHAVDNRNIRMYNIQALACALQLGQEWIHGVHNRLNSSTGIPRRVRETKLKWLKDAVNWALSWEFEIDLGSDMGETRRENEHVEKETESKKKISCAPVLQNRSCCKFFCTTRLQNRESRQERKNGPSLHNEHDLSNLSPEAENWYGNLLRFADSALFFTGPAVTNDKSNRVAAYADTDFAVQILQDPSANVPSFLVFAPVCDQSDPDSALTLCMPEVLANEEYRYLSRLWILKKSREDDTGRRFDLVSKTKLIGTADAPKGERMGKVVIVG